MAQEKKWLKITCFVSIQKQQGFYSIFLTIKVCMYVFNKAVVSDVLCSFCLFCSIQSLSKPTCVPLCFASFFSLATTPLTPHDLCTAESTEVSWWQQWKALRQKMLTEQLQWLPLLRKIILIELFKTSKS